MTKPELKSRLIQRIQNLEDERTMKLIDNLLNSFEDPKANSIWQSLTDEQRKRALLSYEQSFDENKLMDWEEFYKSKR